MKKTKILMNAMLMANILAIEPSAAEESYESKFKFPELFKTERCPIENSCNQGCTNGHNGSCINGGC